MLIYLSMIDSEEERSKFESIYHEYKNLMYYIANRILGDTRDSEDIVHQAFLKIIDIIERIDEVKCPKTKSLIVTITERTAIDLYRSRKRRPVVSFDEDYIWKRPYPVYGRFSLVKTQYIMVLCCFVLLHFVACRLFVA